MKKISVITINFNNAIGLKKTINSVVTQPMFESCVEYIIIDGASTDASVDIIRENEKYLEHWISEKDNGIFHAMNKGVEIAKGSYVIYMNSGDTFSEGALNDNFISNMKSELIYGDYYLNNVSRSNYHKQTSIIDFAFLISKTICHQSIFIKRELCKKYPFEYEYHLVGDWVQLFKIIKNETLTIQYINVPVCVYNTEGVSSKYNDSRLEQRKKFLDLNYSQWEMSTLSRIGRLRTRKYYYWLIDSLDSYRRTLILKWIAKIF